MKWRIVKLAEVTQINPRRQYASINEDDHVSFVPMDAIDEITGQIVSARIRPYREVKKGYTAFLEGDVIFAKITPCMQNGKHAIAHNLMNGIGFGSTEFHIVRPMQGILSEWIHYFLRRDDVIAAAVKSFTGTVGQQRVPANFLEELKIPLPSIDQQRSITNHITAKLFTIEEARKGLLQQIQHIITLGSAIIHETLNNSDIKSFPLGNVLDEIKQGIGSRWIDYPVLGATRDGLAPAKEPVGKNPERYKPVLPGTVFYNPMRILIGSIAMVDEDDPPGITSPDYVVLRGKEGLLDSRWFYYWLRSPAGERCIASLARGAVRERMLFNRLAEGEINLPPYSVQLAASQALAELRPLKQGIEARLRDIELLPARLLDNAFDFKEKSSHAR